MSSSEYIDWLNYINVQMNRYFPLPFIILGTIGVFLNVIIFTRRSLFNNSCVQYLLANTLSNLIVLYWVAVTRIFSDGYGNDLSIRSDTFCRIRYFLTYYSRTLSTWFIVLACSDRWLASNQARNRFNTVSFARKAILIACALCFVCYFHVLFLFGTQRSSNSSTVSCYAMLGVYRLLSDLQYLIFYAVGPPVLMLLFGLFTLRNIRRNRSLVLPTNNVQNPLQVQAIKRRDNQLLMMLLLQVLIIIVFTLPFATQKLVDTFNTTANQTRLEKAQYALLTGILRLVSYGSHAFGFFFYTMAARIFRTELLKIFNAIYRCLTGKNFFTPARSAIFGLTLAKNEVDMTQTVHHQQDQRK